MKCFAGVSYQVGLILLAVMGLSAVLLGQFAQAGTIYCGTNFDLVVSDPVSVGVTPLMAVTLTAVGKNGALPNTFDSTRSGKGGTGITTSGYALHQIYEFNASPNPTEKLIVPGSIPQNLDTHFLINDGEYVTGTIIPSEDRHALNSTEHVYGGYGDSLYGTFSITGASSSSWDFAYLVVPDNMTVSFYFEIGAADYNSETVQTSFLVTSVPEPSALVLLTLGVAGLLAYRWRRAW